MNRHGLVDDDGGPAVAVLVRRNKRIGPIVEAIRERGIPASGRGGGSLLDADAAVVVLQAFRWAASPLDSVAAYDVARSPLGRLLDIEKPSLSQGIPDEDLQRVSNALRSRIDREGPAAMVDDWRRQLEPHLGARERIRLRQLVEFFEGIAGTVNDPEVLVHLARHARVDDPAAEGVLVMNVHQAKGLEFEGVVMTDLGQAIAPRQPSLAWEDPATPISEITRMCTWYAEGARPDDVVPAHEQSIARMVREKLCGLYVALTRARRDLIMQVPPPMLSRKGEENKTTRATLGGVLRSALAEGEDVSDLSDTEPTVVWECGEEESSRGEMVVEDEVQDIRPRITMALPPEHDAQKHPAFASAQLSGVFNLDTHSKTDTGTAMHACFELIEWLDEGLPTAEAIDQAIVRACPRRDLAWRDACRADFLTILGSDQIQGLLSHPGGSLQVFREQPLIRTTSRGVESVIIDRLILAYDDAGRVVGAEVVDFKTDHGIDQDLLLQRHTNQLRRYVEVVGGVFGISNDKIGAQLAHVDQGMVHRVSFAGSG